MNKFKKLIWTIAVALIFTATATLGTAAEAYGITNDWGLNLQEIKNENAKVNSVINETVNKIETDKQKINEEVKSIKEKAVEISKDNQTKITTEAKKTQEIVNTQIEKSNITHVSSGGSPVQQASSNQNGITVQTGVSKPVNVTTKVSVPVNVSPSTNVNVAPSTRVNIINKPSNNNISISIPIVRINSIIINKPKTIPILNKLPSVIPLPVIILKPIVIPLPNFTGGNTTAVPAAAVTTTETTKAVNEAVFAGLPQTGTIIDFNVLIVTGCISVVLGIIFLMLGKKVHKKIL